MAPLHSVYVSSPFCHFSLLLERLISLLFKDTKPLEELFKFVQFPCTFHAQNGRSSALLVDGKSQHSDDNFALYFALSNGHRRISWTFHIQILYNKLTFHTLQKLFTLYTLFTDVNLFTGVIETPLTKFAIPQFHCITRRFTHHCPSCRHVQLRKQTDATKNRFGELSCFKSEVRNYRDQIRVFSRSSRSQLRRSIFAANNRKKNLWHPG